MKSTERFEEMSRDGKLKLIQQPDGDIVVVVIPDTEEMERRHLPPFGITAEFCAYSGGGRSPHTLEALNNLFKAMELDNKENPQHRK